MAELGELGRDARIQLSDLAIEAGNLTRENPDLSGQRRLEATDADARARRLDQGSGRRLPLKKLG